MNCAGVGPNDPSDTRNPFGDESALIEQLNSRVSENIHAGRHAANKAGKPEVPCGPEACVNGDNSSSGARLLPGAPTPDGEQAVTVPTVPPGVDPDIFRSLPAEIQRDVVRQQTNISAPSETQTPVRITSRADTLPRTMRIQSNVEVRRNGNDHLLSVLDSALAISSMPLTRTSIPRPPKRRRLREPRLLRSAVQQIALQNERLAGEMIRFHEVSRSRRRDQ